MLVWSNLSCHVRAIALPRPNGTDAVINEIIYLAQTLA